MNRPHSCNCSDGWSQACITIMRVSIVVSSPRTASPHNLGIVWYTKDSKSRDKQTSVTIATMPTVTLWQINIYRGSLPRLSITTLGRLIYYVMLCECWLPCSCVRYGHAQKLSLGLFFFFFCQLNPRPPFGFLPLFFPSPFFGPSLLPSSPTHQQEPAYRRKGPDSRYSSSSNTPSNTSCRAALGDHEQPDSHTACSSSLLRDVLPLSVIFQ